MRWLTGWTRMEPEIKKPFSICVSMCLNFALLVLSSQLRRPFCAILWSDPVRYGVSCNEFGSSFLFPVLETGSKHSRFWYKCLVEHWADWRRIFSWSGGQLTVFSASLTLHLGSSAPPAGTLGSFPVIPLVLIGLIFLWWQLLIVEHRKCRTRPDFQNKGHIIVWISESQ